MLSTDDKVVSVVKPLLKGASEHTDGVCLAIEVVADLVPNTTLVPSDDDEVVMLRSVFDPIEKQLMESLTGKFTRSNYCNVDDGIHNPFPLTSSSPRMVFTSQSCAHEHMWIDPPHNQIEKYLAHYAKCKSEYPATTSAVVMVPRWVGGSHWKNI